MRTIKASGWMLAAACVVLATAGVASAGSWYLTVQDLFPGPKIDGVYDEPNNCVNQVDFEAAGNPKTLTQFKTDLLSARNSNYGDVIGFDYGRGILDATDQALKPEGWFGGSGHAANWVYSETHPHQNNYDPNGAVNAVRLWYGADMVMDSTPLANDGNGQYIEMKLYAFGPDQEQILDLYLNGPGAYGMGQQTSGWAQYWEPYSFRSNATWDENMDDVMDPNEMKDVVGVAGRIGTHAAAHYYNRFGDHSKIDFVNETTENTQIVELGITALAQTRVETVTVTAWFSGGGYEDRTAILGVEDPNNPGTYLPGMGLADTFFYFTAPEGQTITALEWLSDQQRPQFDDLAFILAYTGDRLPGDANEDGIVDSQDFTILKANFGNPGGWGEGDFNDDGIIDSQDFTILKAHFGETAAGVPEPATMSLLTLGGLALLRRRR